MEIEQQETTSNEELQEVRVIENDHVLSEDRTILVSYTGNKLSYVLPDTVETIADSAFSNCYSLYSINMTGNLVRIAKGAFEYCTRLALITFPDSITEIDEYAFFYCDNLKSVRMANNVTFVGEGAWGCCKNLESVIISSKVDTIEVGTFKDCPSLKEIHCKNPIPPSVMKAAFGGTTKIQECTLYIPKGVLDAYKEATGWKDFKEILEE